jgi:hypothetical protein
MTGKPWYRNWYKEWWGIFLIIFIFLYLSYDLVNVINIYNQQKTKDQLKEPQSKLIEEPQNRPIDVLRPMAIYKVSIDFADMENSLNTKTSIQAAAYLKSLYGKEVLWMGRLIDASEDEGNYLVSVDMEPNRSISLARLLGRPDVTFYVSRDTAMSLRKDDIIFFAGRIKSFQDLGNVVSPELDSVQMLLRTNKEDTREWWVVTKGHQCISHVLSGEKISPQLLSDLGVKVIRIMVYDTSKNTMLVSFASRNNPERTHDIESSLDLCRAILHYEQKKEEPKL